jgi:hypothetical protein
VFRPTKRKGFKRLLGHRPLLYINTRLQALVRHLPSDEFISKTLLYNETDSEQLCQGVHDECRISTVLPIFCTLDG